MDKKGPGNILQDQRKDNPMDNPKVCCFYFMALNFGDNKKNKRVSFYFLAHIFLYFTDGGVAECFGEDEAGVGSH